MSYFSFIAFSCCEGQTLRDVFGVCKPNYFIKYHLTSRKLSHMFLPSTKGKTKMTMNKTIEMARSYLNAGNETAYARIMSGAIRSSLSDRSVKAFRSAISEDGAERLFINFNTSCPLGA
jgi:hypothetical protein